MTIPTSPGIEMDKAVAKACGRRCIVDEVPPDWFKAVMIADDPDEEREVIYFSRQFSPSSDTNHSHEAAEWFCQRREIVDTFTVGNPELPCLLMKADTFVEFQPNGATITRYYAGLYQWGKAASVLSQTEYGGVQFREVHRTPANTIAEAICLVILEVDQWYRAKIENATKETHDSR